MKRVSILTMLAILLAIPGAADEWYEHYEKGVRAVERGDPAVAISELQDAMAIREVGGLSLPTRPYEYVDYTPRLFLAIAHHMNGDPEEARRQLEASEAAGVAVRSEYGRHLLEAQRVLLTGLASQPLPAQPRLSDYWATPKLLTEDEFSRLKENVFASCDGPFERAAEGKWYDHYEAAIDASERGERSLALESLLNAVVERPDPQRRARTYGMWLVDYYPYFQIARIHAQEENWSCARDALEISKRLNEIDSTAREFNEMMMLDYETQRRLVEVRGER